MYAIMHIDTEVYVKDRKGNALTFQHPDNAGWWIHFQLNPSSEYMIVMFPELTQV